MCQLNLPTDRASNEENYNFLPLRGKVVDLVVV